jgi:hypothetical protein
LVGSWRVAAEQRPSTPPTGAFWPNVYSFFADGLALATNEVGATRHGAWRAWEDGTVYAQFWSNRIPPPAEPPISLGLWDWAIVNGELRSRGRPLLRRINADEWPRPGREGVKGLWQQPALAEEAGEARSGGESAPSSDRRDR